MFDIFLTDGAMPFTIAIVIALCLGILELVNLTIGGVTDWFDTLIPEKDFAIDAGGFSATDFLCIGRIPLLMWLVIMLTSFGLIGVVFQSILTTPLWIAVPVTLFVAVFPVRYISLFLQKILPKDETYAVTGESMLGQTATINGDMCSKKQSAMAKTTDLHGYHHYILVVPENPGETFVRNEKVILYKCEGHRYTVIKNENLF